MINQKLVLVGCILFILGLFSFIIININVEQEIQSGFFRHDMTHGEELILILYFSSPGIIVLSIPFIIRGFWNHRTALIIMIPLFGVLSVVVPILVAILRAINAIGLE